MPNFVTMEDMRAYVASWMPRRAKKSAKEGHPHDLLNMLNASGVLNADLTEVDATNTGVGVENSLYSYTIPAKTLGSTDGFHLHLSGDALVNAAGTLTLRVKLGATTVFTSTAQDWTDAATRYKWTLDVICKNSASSAQKWDAMFMAEAGTADFPIARIDQTAGVLGNGYSTSAEDTTTALALSVTAEWSAASASLSFRKEIGYVERVGVSVGATTSGSTGVTDHGALTGLADDDHTQYGALAQAETWDLLQTFTSGIATDTIAERTATLGVTVDGVLLKDYHVTVADLSGGNPVLIRGSAAGLDVRNAANSAYANLNALAGQYSDYLQTPEFRLSPGADLTIATGAITVSASSYAVLPESGTSDDLNLINQDTVAEGRLLILRASDTTKTIVIKHNSGVESNNILCVGNADITLDDSHDFAILYYSSALVKWIAGGFGGGGSVATDVIWDAAGDLAVGTGADTAARLPITVPAANILEVLGVVNGETTATWKAVHDGTAPVTQAFGDVAAAGTALTAAHRDHKHGMPSLNKQIYLPASAFAPKITTGSTVALQQATVTNAVNAWGLDFNDEDMAFTTFLIPLDWTGSTFTVKVLWLSTGTTGVNWQLRAYCLGDAEALDTAMGSWADCPSGAGKDTGNTVGSLYITAASAAITPAGGTPQPGELAILDIKVESFTTALYTTLAGVVITYT